jgi:glycosyltransferase involved in cell wall biosynthesis
MLGHSVFMLSLPGSDPEKTSGVSSGQKTDKVEISPSKLSSFISSLLALTKYVPEFVFELIELAYNLVAFFRVGRDLHVKKADLLYERYSLFMFAGVLQARRAGVPIILEVNDAAIVERVRPLFFKCLARKIEHWILTHCDGIVFISTNFKETVERVHGVVAPGVVCPNAADIKQFSLQGVDRTKAKKSVGLESKVVCGYVGAFHHWHGIEWFVKEIAPRMTEQEHLALLLLGDGPVYDDIKAIVKQYGIESQVIMPGRVPHAEVKQYIAAMDYGILPDSNQYGSPMKLFEMMAMEVALVSPSFEPISEVISDTENGWLFQPNERLEAVQRVIDLSNDLSHIQKVGQQAGSYIRDHRQWTHNVERVLGLYNNLS